MNNGAYNDIKDHLLQIFALADQGEIEMVDALVRLKNQEKKLKELIGYISSYIDDNFTDIELNAQYHENTFRGHKIEFRSGSKQWNFKGIPEIVDAEVKLKGLKSKYQSYFMASQRGELMATADGEEIILPELSYKKSSVIVKEAKS